MNRHPLILFTFCLPMLSACTTDSVKHRPFLNQTRQAESFMAQGQHKQAASVYQALANTAPKQRDQFNLLAAEALIKSGDSQAAQAYADSINITSLSAEQRNRLNLLYAQIYLSNGNAEQALNKLINTQPYNLSVNHQISYYQSLAFAYSLTGELIQSTQARIKLTPLLTDDYQKNENNQVILNTLSLLPTETLHLSQPTDDHILAGWMSLSRVLKSSGLNQSSPEFQTNLAEWKRAFPSHPANAYFLQSYLSGLTHSFKLPNAIAVLIPETGRFAQAADIIKQGFMAAYQSSQTGFQPSLRFYDSNATNPVSLYHQAIANGAELIIGPLDKENIQNLALSTELTTPVLALNHVDNLAQDNLFQFGLSPIDEAQEISRKALEDGRKNVLILTPESNKGERTSDYLADYWQQSQGNVLESKHYNRRENDFSKPIKDLLNLNESIYRYNQLKRVLRTTIHFTERRRRDVDAIFLSAPATTARSIYPQLRFYRATGVPVYATPDVYTGITNASLDIDLNSITFCDIPWVFDEAYSGELSQTALSHIWQSAPNKYLRLVAFGIDAFNIIPHLDQLNSTPYSGATGTLAINRENRITRQLLCAQFTDGIPKLLDYNQQPNIIDDDQITDTENFIP